MKLLLNNWFSNNMIDDAKLFVYQSLEPSQEQKSRVFSGLSKKGKGHHNSRNGYYRRQLAHQIRHLMNSIRKARSRAFRIVSVVLNQRGQYRYPHNNA